MVVPTVNEQNKNMLSFGEKKKDIQTDSLDRRTIGQMCKLVPGKSVMKENARL